MTTAEVVSALTAAGWDRAVGARDGFRVVQDSRGIIVSWYSLSWNPKTQGRMLRNYENSLKKTFKVKLLGSHLVVERALT